LMSIKERCEIIFNADEAYAALQDLGSNLAALLLRRAFREITWQASRQCRRAVNVDQTFKASSCIFRCAFFLIYASAEPVTP
jgi:hypothetical protein